MTRSKQSELIEKAIIKHNNFYDYSEVEYVNANTKVKIKCPVHGPFYQLLRKHAKNNKCPKCSSSDVNSNRRLTVEEFINRCKTIHNNYYIYDDSCYTGLHNKIDIRCPEHGTFSQIALNHLVGHGCKICGSKLRRFHRAKNTSRIKNEFKYTTKQFIELAIAKHGDRYDYSRVEYINSQHKITIICKVHGEFEQFPQYHLQGYGCKLCVPLYLSDLNARGVDDFIRIANEVHGHKYNYSKVIYINQDTDVEIICDDHGSFYQKPRHHLRGQSCAKCHISSGHNELIQYLENIEDIVINDRAIIDPFEIDIYCPKKKVGIEYHGIYWHSYDRPETKEEIFKHYNKATLASNAGIRLLQIYENEFISNPNIIRSIIRSKLGITNKLHARKLNIISINDKVARGFYDFNHIQGHRAAFVHYALVDDKIRCCMSFSHHPKYEWEIIRYANRCGETVVGGASRLFKHFIDNHNPMSVMSFADRRYSDGNLYNVLGFKLVEITDPNYKYVRANEVYSRQSFQKHKLNKKLQNFDPQLSESINMFNNGYRRLWDAGNYKFIWIMKE